MPDLQQEVIIPSVDDALMGANLCNVAPNILSMLIQIKPDVFSHLISAA